MTGFEEVALVMAIVGSAASAYGMYQQGQQTKKMDNYNAQVADQDAKIAQDQAAAQAEQDQRMSVLRLGAAKALGGSSGVTSAGSPIDVLGDMAAQGELQRQQTLTEGALHTRASLNTAASERMSGANAASSGNLGAAGALLGGVSAGTSNYSALKRAKT